MATSPRGERPAGSLPEEQERLRRETDAALRLEGEMVRRLSRHGLRSVDEMVELHERLRRAADAIALPEIDFALARLASLGDRLRLLRARLDRLSVARRALSPGGPPGTLEETLGDPPNPQPLPRSGRNGNGAGGRGSAGSR